MGGKVLQTTYSDVNGFYTLTGLSGDPFEIRVYGPSNEYITWLGYVYSSGISQDMLGRDLYLQKNMTLLSPANNATVTTVRPTLKAVPEATEYGIQINVTDTWELVEMVSGIKDNSYVPTVDLTSGVTYTWQVGAKDALGHEIAGPHAAVEGPALTRDSPMSPGCYISCSITWKEEVARY